MNRKNELIANIVLITIGIIGGTIFFFIAALELSSIFFAIALASILYQFLGGIGDSNSFQLGALKFCGSSAVLIGFILFLHYNIFSEEKIVEEKINYSEKNWIPINYETGKTLSPPLTISNGRYTDSFPKPDLAVKRMLHSFKVMENEEGKFTIYSTDTTEKIGNFNITDISSNSLFDKVVIDNSETNVQIFRLEPDNKNLNSTKHIKELNLPFEIKVFNRSRFKISRDGKPLKEYVDREVVPRASYIIPISKKEFYVAFLEQASNLIDEKHTERYSKWVVKKLKKTIANNDVY